MNNNRTLSKLFDVYNTFEISFKRDSGSLGTMTIVVKREVKWRRQNNSKGTNFLYERMDIGRGKCKKCLAKCQEHTFRRDCKLFLNKFKTVGSSTWIHDSVLATMFYNCCKSVLIKSRRLMREEKVLHIRNVNQI